MKTFLIRRRSLSLLACAVVACLMFCVINYPAAVDASAATRQLPIYCVQRDQKLVSISFDAAWGDVRLRHPGYPGCRNPFVLEIALVMQFVNGVLDFSI